MTSTESVVATAATTRPGRRGLGVAVTGCAVSGGVVLLAVGRVWLRYTMPRAGLAALRATATGHVVAQTAATLALVVLAGVVVLPATKGLGRRVAGVLIALGGIGIGYASVLTIAFTTDQVPTSGSTKLLDGRATGWPWVSTVAGLIAVGIGLFAALASGPWPSMGRRYESGPAAGGGKARPVTDVSMWDRLDEGDDPTT